MSDPAVLACPFPTYLKLQRDTPVFHDPVTGYYEITRYDDIRAVALNPSVFSNKVNRQNRRSATLQADMQRLYESAGFAPQATLLNNDPPSHRAVRSLVDKAFMPARIGLLQPAITAEVTGLIDRVIDRGHMEFMSEYAVSLPLNIIADQLGVAREQRRVIKSGSDALVAVADPMTPDEVMLELTRRIIAMQTLLADRIRHVRMHPDDTILSVVANSEGPEAPHEMPMMVHLFQSILVAGNETTSNALGNGLLMMIDEPLLFERIRDEPGRTRSFVEESLRVKAPFQGFYRVTTQDAEVAGMPIPKGAIVFLRWGAAGYDSKYFKCPAKLDLDTENPTKHLAFGAGGHFCLGNLLARTEMRISFEQITQRMSNLRLGRGSNSRVLAPTFLNQGVSRIELEFDRRT